MSIIGILVVTLPLKGEVIILNQGSGPHLIFCGLLVLRPITPPDLHVVLEEWA